MTHQPSLNQDLRTALAQTCARAISDANITNCRADEALPVVDAMLAALRASPPRLDLISAAKAMAHKLVVEFGFLDHQHELKQLREAIGRAEAAPPHPVDAERVAAWDGATLETRLRSYPAAPPGSDALSCGYVSTLMIEAADALASPAHSPGKAVTREGVDRERLSNAIDAALDRLRFCHQDATADWLDAAADNYLRVSLATKPTGTEAGRGVGAEDEALRYAESLCRALYDKHWNVDAPEWQPLAGDLIGLLSQIDNMTAGLTRAATPTPPLSPDSTGPADICHDDQLAIWSGDIIGSLGMGGYLREDISYDDKLHLYALVDAEIKGICAALTPSAPIAAPVRDDGTRERIARGLVAAEKRAEEARKAWNVCDQNWNATLRSVEHQRRIDARKELDEALGLVERHKEMACHHFRALASLTAPAGDVPGEAQTQEGGR